MGGKARNLIEVIFEKFKLKTIGENQSSFQRLFMVQNRKISRKIISKSSPQMEKSEKSMNWLAIKGRQTHDFLFHY